MTHSYTDFLPLIFIMSIIVMYTTLMVYYHGSFDAYYTMRHFEGAFFIIFGGFKLLNWPGFVTAYRMYDIIAKRSLLYAYCYPIIELALGVGYLTTYRPLLTNSITLAMMIIGTIGVANALMQQQKITCACLGAVFKIPMTLVTLVEDILMGLMALMMILLITYS